ncbi:hypothetical protein ACFL4T_11485 [candidate division KSB1 bacterium]
MKLKVLIISSALFISSSALSQVSFRGYVENRLFISKRDKGFSDTSPNEKLAVGGWNRARVTAESNISEISYVNITLDYFNYFGEFARLYRLFEEQENSNTPYQKIRLDRAYLQITKEKFQVTAGMQRISLGKSFIWSPFDVFNRINTTEPQEEKGGVNAVKFTYYPSNLSRIMLIASPEETFGESRLGFLADFNYKNTDFEIGVIKDYDGFRKRLIAGFNLKGELEAGYWIELAFIKEKNYVPVYGGTADLEADYHWYRNYIIGIDYTLNIGNGLYVMAEYFNYDLGADDREDYDHMVLFGGRKSLLARDYLFGSIRYPISMFSNISVAAIRNMVDGGMIIIPNYSLDITRDVSLIAGMNLFSAEKGDEYNPPMSIMPVDLIGKNQFYLWLKVSF